MSSEVQQALTHIFWQVHTGVITAMEESIDTVLQTLNSCEIEWSRSHCGVSISYDAAEKAGFYGEMMVSLSLSSIVTAAVCSILAMTAFIVIS